MCDNNYWVKNTGPNACFRELVSRYYCIQVVVFPITLFLSFTYLPSLASVFHQIGVLFLIVQIYWGCKLNGRDKPGADASIF
jgi:hypothetical protein